MFVAGILTVTSPFETASSQVADQVREAADAAPVGKVDLSGWDMSGDNMTDLDLTSASLARADPSGADPEA